jgi:hypothetical protein
MKEYPYEQNRVVIHNQECEVCHLVKGQLFEIEWRVDWFQGNCEFEKICGSCLMKRANEEAKRIAEYERKMKPIWDKQIADRKVNENFLHEQAHNLGLEIKKYPNGQWSFGDVLDWWTTTGTARERKSHIYHSFSFSDSEKIIKLITKII